MGVFLMEYLFELPYKKSQPDSNIKTYFDFMYDEGDFLRAVSNIVQKKDCVMEGAYCLFPDMESEDESEHFSGVSFEIGFSLTNENTVIVSEAVCFQYIQLACERYLRKHPEDAEIINSILLKNQLSID